MAEPSRFKLSWKALNAPLQRKRFHVRPPGSITALDVDGSVLRVVQTAPRGGRPIVARISAERLDLPADADRSDPGVMGQAIAKALDRLDVKPSSVVMGVPRASVVLRTLSLPMLDDVRELASIVHLQVGRDLPFRPDEAVIDFKVRRQTGEPSRTEPGGKPGDAASEARGEPAVMAKLEVLVAAAQREVVEFYRKSAEIAGLKLAALGLLSWGNARCVEACRVAEGSEALALVSLRPDEVGIDVVSQQSLLFSRGAAIKPRTEPVLPPVDSVAQPAPSSGDGGEGPANESAALGLQPPPAPQPETFVDLVAIEVVRSLHSCGGIEPNNPVGKVIVVGATGHEPAVVEALQYRLSIPCTWLDVAGTLELPSAAREHAAGSIASIGLALGVNDAQGLPLDFLHPKRPAVHRDMRRIRILASVAAAAAAMIFLVAVQRHLKRQHEAVRDRLKAELTEAKKKQPIYTRMRQQAATLDGWVTESANWLQHYTYLSAILPPTEDVYITSFVVSAQGAGPGSSGRHAIHLSVQARSGETLSKLDKQLRAAGYDVKPLAITPGADRYGYGFRSSVELIVPDKMKIDLSKVKAPARPGDDASLDSPRRRGGGG
jgi:Tfp pilus assembly PilM family ATPase